MSANYYWSPVGKAKSLDVASKSDFGSAMQDTFGTFPITLNSTHYPQLTAMAHVIRQGSNPYAELLDLVERHGEIEVRREY